MKTMTFLVNPRGKRRRASGRGTQRRNKRPPPKGWASWKAYMASIRPGAKKARASTSSGSSSMASRKGKKRHARRRASTRSNPARHARRRVTHVTHRRRHRRNPMGVRARSIGGALKRLPQFALHSGIKAGGALAGVVLARKVRGLANQQAGSMLGALIEASVGIVGGALVSTVSPSIGEGIAIGGILAPAMTAVQNMKIPHISDSLGDDGYLVGGDSGVTLVSAFPEDYAALGRYANPPARPLLVTANAKNESKYA